MEKCVNINCHLSLVSSDDIAAAASPEWKQIGPFIIMWNRFCEKYHIIPFDVCSGHVSSFFPIFLVLCGSFFRLNILCWHHYPLLDDICISDFEQWSESSAIFVNLTLVQFSTSLSIHSASVHISFRQVCKANFIKILKDVHILCHHRLPRHSVRHKFARVVSLFSMACIC